MRDVGSDTGAAALRYARVQMHDLARVRAALAASDAVTLRPPATEAALAGFEARHRVALPAAYRTFAAAVCDGLLVDGEPMLYSLAEIEADLVANHADPAAPFPYDATATAVLRAALAATDDPLGDPTVVSLQRAGWPNGALTIAGHGGNDFTVLVVTGDQAGITWRTGELDAPETMAVYQINDDATTPLDFLAWLAVWAPCMLGVEVVD